MPALLLAETHYEQNNCAAARTLIEDYMEVCHGLGYVDKLIAAYVTRARLEASDGQYRIAQRTLDEGDRCARATGFPRLQAHMLCERMRQLLANGNTVAVIDLARVSGLLGSCSTLQPHGRVTTITECVAISWSYAARANGDFDGAIRLLKNWYRFAMSDNVSDPALRFGIELAALYCQREDISAARHYSLRGDPNRGIAWPGRSFIDAGREIHQVLRGAVAAMWWTARF